MLEYDAGGAGQVQLHHGFADRKPLQRRGRFRNDDRAVAGDLVVALSRRLDDVARRVEYRGVHLGKRRGSRVRLGRGAVLDVGLVVEGAVTVCQWAMVRATHMIWLIVDGPVSAS